MQAPSAETMATVIEPAIDQSYDEPTIWRAVDDIDLDAWESVRQPDDIFMNVRFLRAIECSLGEQTDFFYLLFRSADGSPAAITCLSTHVMDGTLMTPPGRMKQALSLLGRVLPWTVYYKLLFCGIPLSAGQSHLRFAPGADRAGIIAALCRIMDRVAATHRARVIVWKEFSDDERAGSDEVLKYGYRRADSPPMNVALRQFTSFDGFLASLNSDRRNKIRRSLKKLAGGNLRILRTSDPEEIQRRFTDAVHRLYISMFERSDTKVEFMPAEFFRQLPVHLRENCRFHFLLRGEQVLAFGASVLSASSYHPLLAGVDYEHNAAFDLYFNMMYETFADALSHDVATIHVGANADEFKQARLGCHPEPRSIYIKGARVPIRLVLRLLFDRLFPAIDVTSRPH